MSLVKQQPPILGLTTETSFLRLSWMMYLNFTRGGSGDNFSKSAGYQGGYWLNLSPVWTGNSCTWASFWCLNWVFLTKNQIHFFNGIFFSRITLYRGKKCEVDELLTFEIQFAHLCSTALWRQAPQFAHSLGQEAVQGMIWGCVEKPRPLIFPPSCCLFLP